MLAKEKWQIKTLAALEYVFQERIDQMKKHGEAMLALPDGTGPGVTWLAPITEAMEPGTGDHVFDAEQIQLAFREEYDTLRAIPGGKFGQLTRMHLVREELAEAFELDGDDPRFFHEIKQVAALCVQWMEYKLEQADL